MKKNYLFTLAALLLGSTIANAQKPLDGYEEPTFPKDGNVGNIVSFSTSGALEDLESQHRNFTQYYNPGKRRRGNHLPAPHDVFRG